MTTGDVEAFDVADLLSSLVNKSLVTAERSSTSLRYRLLETIRQYAADQLIQVGGEPDALEARRLHAEYYLKLCEEAAPELSGPKQGIWLKRLDLEWDNLQAAFSTLASDPERTEEVLRLGVAVTHFLTTRQHQSPIALLREALMRDVEVTTALKAQALLALSTMIQMMPTGERPREKARDLCEEAVKLARELGDQSLEAEALVWLSFIPKGRPMRYSRSLEQGEPGLAHAEAALEIARRINDPRLVGHALYALAQVQPSRGEADREIYLEALENLRQAGDLIWVCSTLLSLSVGRLTDREQVRGGSGSGGGGYGTRRGGRFQLPPANPLGEPWHLLLPLGGSRSSREIQPPCAAVGPSSRPSAGPERLERLCPRVLRNEQRRLRASSAADGRP